MDKVRSESFFWAGVGGLAVWAWWSLPSIQHPLGSDWGHYFTVAEYIWDPKDGLAYPDFRKPWFGWLIGGLGQLFGYFPAAQGVAKLSMVLMVFSAALLGKALANRWTGLAAAFVIPLMPLAMDGALWVNHYPLLGATVGLSVGAGAMLVRSPSLIWAGLAGVAAGVAYALDLRGAIALPIVAALMGCACLGQVWSLNAKRIGLVALGAGTILAHDAWLQRAFDVPQLPFDRQLEVQRKGTLEQIQQGVFDNQALQEACAGQRPDQLNRQAIESSCGRELAQASRRRLAAMKIIPTDDFIWWIPIALMPLGLRRSHLQRSLAASIVFLVPFASLWVGMRWVTYFDRYWIPFAVPLASLAPVGIGNMMAFTAGVLRHSSVLPGFAAGVGSIWFALTMWPGWTARALDAPELAKSSEYHAGVFADWARSSVAADDSIVDCAGLAVDSLMLPAKIDYVRFPPGDPECNQRIQNIQSTGKTVFLITMHRDIPPQYGAEYLAFNPALIEAAGWIPVEHDLRVDGFRLWQSK